MKAYHIYLLRHGLIKANEEGRYIGRTDMPLSPEGEAQLAEMLQKFKYPYAERFYSSPKKRCLQTLAILYPEAEPHIVEGLAECDFGDYEGKTLDELKGDAQYREWAAGGASAPPNGESAQDFQKRVCLAFEQILGTLMRDGTDSAVIMTHGGTIMSILGAFGFPRRPMYEWMTGNGMGYELLVTPQLWMSARAFEVAARIPEEAEDDNLAGLSDFVDEMRKSAENAEEEA